MLAPIRVLCVFSTLDRGGAESMCMNLYRHIDRGKVQFDFVKHTHKKGAFEDEITSLGGHIYEAPRYKIYNHLIYEEWWKNHLRNHSEHKIIHGHFFTISAVYFRISRKFGCINIAHSHCTNRPLELQRKSIKNYFEPAVMKNICKYSDVRLACSKKAGIDVFGNNEFTVFNNAIDVEQFRANPEEARRVREEFGIQDSFILGNISRFNIQKNPLGTLNIFKLVHERCPNSKLLWIGDGPMRTEVKSKAEEYGIIEDIIFTGVRNDVARLLQGMDVFVFPSFYEGLGIAAVEAQAAGVYTYCSDTIPHEVAVTELCHFLALNPLSVWGEEISQISHSYTHPDMRDQIRKSGYDIYDTAKWLQNLYLTVLKK